MSTNRTLIASVAVLLPSNQWRDPQALSLLEAVLSGFLQDPADKRSLP